MDYSQMQNNSMQLVVAPYDTALLYTEIIELIKTRAEEKKLKLLVEIDPSLPKTMSGDERRIIQIVLNLLTNAVKYTREGEIKLRVVGESLGDDLVELSIIVSDTGIGIKKENLKYLFASYAQFDREKNSKIEGNGLGLAITQELIAMMDGTISVDSVYTKGSTFTVKINQKRISEEAIGEIDFVSGAYNNAKSTRYQHTFEASKARILVVDDDEVNQNIIKSLLKQTKVQVDTAGSGHKALPLTLQNHYDIIYLDYMMPDMNGVQVMQAIREQEDGMCANSVFIAFTGTAFTERELRSGAEDFDSVLTKPVSGSDLEKTTLEFLSDELIEYRLDPHAEISSRVRTSFARGRKKKIKITTDCICDLPMDMMENNDVQAMYLYLRTDSGRFLDTVEVSSNNFSNFIVGDGRTVEPVPASVEDYERFFGDALAEAEDVIHLSANRRMSHCYEMAVQAAEGFDHVHVLNTGQISGGLGLLVLQVCKWVKEGYSAQEIIDRVDKTTEYTSSHFVLANPSLFVAEGLMSKRMGKIFNVFNIHPVLHVNRRLMFALFITGSEERMLMSHIKYCRGVFKGRLQPDTHFIVTHVGLTQRQQDMVVNELSKTFPEQKILIMPASMSISVSTGEGALCFSFMTKNDYI